MFLKSVSEYYGSTTLNCRSITAEDEYEQKTRLLLWQCCWSNRMTALKWWIRQYYAPFQSVAEWLNVMIMLTKKLCLNIHSRHVLRYKKKALLWLIICFFHKKISITSLKILKIIFTASPSLKNKRFWDLWSIIWLKINLYVQSRRIKADLFDVRSEWHRKGAPLCFLLSFLLRNETDIEFLNMDDAQRLSWLLKYETQLFS